MKRIEYAYMVDIAATQTFHAQGRERQLKREVDEVRERKKRGRWEKKRGV